jgi:hypothetical protein
MTTHFPDAMTEPVYARVYLQKADPLVDILIVRRAEIDRRFNGAGCKAVKAITRLKEELL